MDSDNMHGFQFDGFTKQEDEIEVKSPGKLVFSTGHLNSDSDDVPDLADGFNLELYEGPPTNEFLHVGSSLKFVPVQVTLLGDFDRDKTVVVFSYGPLSKPKISPEGIEAVFGPPPWWPGYISSFELLKGGIRLWKAPPVADGSGGAFRASGREVPNATPDNEAPWGTAPWGDFVPPQKEIRWRDIETQPGIAKLYLEYVGNSPGQRGGRVDVSVKATQKNGYTVRGGGYVSGADVECTDSAAATLVYADLDVNNDGDLDDAVDGAEHYLPGYAGDQDKLMDGGVTSFMLRQYGGPQAMRIILPGVGREEADGATFRILDSVSRHSGYCSNWLFDNNGDALEETSADFSFSAEGDQNTISGTVEDDKIWVPVFCKDYAAWCEVEIILTKGGQQIGHPFRITLPRDDGGDGISDHWQNLQIAAWNEQFVPVQPRQISAAGRKMVSPDRDDEEADSDGAGNGDGGRNLPGMPKAGDGLKILEEYRGFVLDGGPGAVPGKHKRLSVARKEMLVECSVEKDLTSPSKSGQDTNQGVLAGFDVTAVMGDVSALYNDPDKGAGIDLYWARDEMVSGPAMTYSGPGGDFANAFPGRNAWEWNGAKDYHYLKELKDEQGNHIGFENVGVTASGVPILDRAFYRIDSDRHDDFYSVRAVGNQDNINSLQADNRNPNLDAFAKLLLPTRRCSVEGGVTDNPATVDPAVPRYLKDATDHSIGNQSGSWVSVAALCDEGIAMKADETGAQHFGAAQFAPLVRMVLSHEIGHQIHPSHYPPTGGDQPGPNVMRGLYFLSDHSLLNWNDFHWHEGEVEEITLPASSIYR
jgi:hypothetical protein